MGGTLAWWLTEALLEPLGLVILGAFAFTIRSGACWLVAVVTRHTQTFRDLGNLIASL